MNQFAIVFPGQGSQTVGMLQEFSNVPLRQQIFGAASDILQYDLWDLIVNGPKEKLDSTVYTQPALLVSSYFLWKRWQNEVGAIPSYFAGHSLGEYTALLAAEALSFEDAVRLVAARGEFMQGATHEGLGAMAAIIGLEDAKVEQICKQAKLENEILSPANFNSFGQVVIAGHKNSVLRAMEIAKSEGAKLTMLLPVSVPSHCALMQDAALKLSDLLKTIHFSEAKIPVIKNVDAKPYQNNAYQNSLVEQLCKPVRWVESMQFLIKQNILTIIECGPGKILSGLNKRIDRNLIVEAFNTDTSIQNLTTKYGVLNAK